MAAAAPNALVGYRHDSGFNYRGGGELLQGLGCGVVLPATGYCAQAAGWESMPPPLMSRCRRKF